MNRHAAFAGAQQLENEGDNDAALAAYTELVRAAEVVTRFVISFQDRNIVLRSFWDIW